jgi:hypothetical protein
MRMSEIGRILPFALIVDQAPKCRKNDKRGNNQVPAMVRSRCIEIEARTIQIDSDRAFVPTQTHYLGRLLSTKTKHVACGREVGGIG